MIKLSIKTQKNLKTAINCAFFLLIMLMIALIVFFHDPVSIVTIVVIIGVVFIILYELSGKIDASIKAKENITETAESTEKNR